VQRLEESAAEVLVIAADVTDENQMQAAVEQALARFGAIHGLVHAAGVPGMGLIQFKTPEAAAEVLAPKVQGTLVLEKALRGVDLDFVVLFSSLTSITGGGPVQVDYCAANAFLDAYAQRADDGSRLTVAIDWGEWQWNAWEEGLAELNEEIRQLLRQNRERFGITFEEGGEALDRILLRRLPQVLVATQGFRRDEGGGELATVSTILNWGRDESQPVAQHPRPVLGVPYTAPRDELERSIADVWSNVLGIAEIGIHDNFFDLGGNSLIGLELARRLQASLEIGRMPARVLYEAPTVETLAQIVSQAGDSAEVVDQRYSRGEIRREVSLQRRQAARERRQKEGNA
jgi:hypothetical protein